MAELLPPALPWEVAAFAVAVQEMVEENDRKPARVPQNYSATPRFRVPAAGVGGVEQHIGWLHSHIPECELAAYAVAFVYLRRFVEKQEEQSGGRTTVGVDSSNFQTLVLLSLITANKWLTQRVYTNAHYAELGGMSTADMNKMEWRFLCAMGFDLHVDADDYQSCIDYLDCTHREVQARRKKAAEEQLEKKQQAELLLLPADLDVLFI